MSTTMTLAELRTAVRQRADMVNSTFVSDSELNSYINQSYFELYDILVQAFGNDYFVADPFQITTDGVNNQFALPEDLYKLIGVDLALSTSLDSYVTIKPFMFAERNRYSVPNMQSFYGVTNLRYRLSGGKLLLTPVPAANQSIRLWYVPRATTLAADADTLDGVSGWTEYVIVDGAIKCGQKEETDVSVLMAQKAALLKRITEAADNRDAGSPQTVSDSRSTDYGYPNGSGYGGTF